MRIKFKAWAKPLLDEHREIAKEKEFLLNLDLSKRINVEIGSGKGDFLIELSKRHPDEVFIAIEKQTTAAGIMLKKMLDLKIDNLFILRSDIADTFDVIKENSVEKIFLNFSDPWPKARHFKRRLTYRSFLDQYYRILKKGGKLIVKTDSDSLFAFTLEELNEFEKFSIIERYDDYSSLTDDDALTEYESSFREKGLAIHKVIAEKK